VTLRLHISPKIYRGRKQNAARIISWNELACRIMVNVESHPCKETLRCSSFCVNNVGDSGKLFPNFKSSHSFKWLKATDGKGGADGRDYELRGLYSQIPSGA